MKSPIQLIEQIIRAKMALHLRLAAASRNGGQDEIGGRRIDDMISEVDAGLSRYELMLVCFKNELAAAAMMASAGMDAEDPGGAPIEARDPGQEP
jgi:hypothetical protein